MPFYKSESGGFREIPATLANSVVGQPLKDVLS